MTLIGYQKKYFGIPGYAKYSAFLLLRKTPIVNLWEEEEEKPVYTNLKKIAKMKFFGQYFIMDKMLHFVRYNQTDNII